VSDNRPFSDTNYESLSPPLVLAERLAAWSEAAQGAYAPSTERAYRADLQAFRGWCVVAQVAPLPAEPSTVAAFLRAEEAAGRAVATLRRRAATIAKVHRAAGLPSPCRAEDVRLALRAIARARGTQQRQAAP